MIARFKKNIGKLVSVVLIIAMAFQSIAAPVSFAGPAAAEPAKITGTWSMDASGSWHFNAQDGAAKDGWYYLNTGNHSAEYNWFCFDANGVMRTGWVEDKNDPSVWYYTGESKDGREGGLVKGWITDPQDGKKYYLDPSTGIMCHGWKQISGVWYYFGESRYADRRWGQDSSGYWTDGKSGKHTYGALYTNEYTPDGYYVGANGAWVQNHSEDDHSDKPDPIPAYGIIVEADGHGTAKAQVGGADVTSAAPGAAVTLVATANDGYAFKSWQIERGLDSITGNSFTMPSNEVKVKAVFEKEYAVEAEAGGHGTVSADVAKGVSGTEVNLTITPDAGYETDQITVVRGGVTVTGNKFNIGTADVKIRVTFKAIVPSAYGIIVEDDGHGTASADPTSAAPGASVTLTATPNDGYAFKEWQIVRGLEAGAIKDNSFIMPSKEVKVKAVFEKEYAVEAEAGGHGTVSADVAKGVSGKEVNLTITPDAGYEKDQITVVRGGVTVTGNKFNIGTADVKIRVTFKAIVPSTYGIIVEDDGHGTASANLTSAAPGTTVTLTATPNDGYAFEKWEIARGLESITGNSFTMPSNEVKVKALFEKEYTVEVEAGGHGSVSANVEKGVSGTEVNLTLTPDAGYEKDQITVVRGGVNVIDNKFNIGTADVKIRVTFKAIVPSAYGIIVEDDGHGTAKAQVGGAAVTSAAPGAAVTLVATANDGYAFKEWQIGRGLEAGAITDNSFTMPSNEVKVKAVFEKEYAVEAEAGGHGTVSADVAKGVSGKEVNLTITPDAGYETDQITVVRGGVTVVDNKFKIGTADVKIRVTFKAIVPDTYGIIVEADGHGTAKAQVGGADVTSAAPGAAVTLIATANDGYAFKSWQIVRGLEAGAITDNSFTMPSKEVKVKATFERVYNITLQTNEHGTASATVGGKTVTTAAASTEVALTATPAEGYQFKEWKVVSGGVTVTDNKFTMPAENVTIKAEFEPVVPVTYMDWDGTKLVEKTTSDYTEVTNSTTTLDGGKFYVVKSENVVIGTLTVTGDGAATLILCDGAKLTTTGDNTNKTAGIQVASGKALVITGQSGCTGELTATGVDRGAGIGGGDNGDGGTVTINGGTVTANGGENGAGIGGGYNGDGGTVTINGGTVTANGGKNGAGIGGGYYGDGGTVNINGGTVTANGGKYGAGIGGGNFGDGGTVNINGGTVTATGGYGEGIGGGFNYMYDTGTVNFGTGVNFTINAGDDIISPMTTAEYSANHSAAYVSIEESAAPTFSTVADILATVAFPVGGLDESQTSPMDPDSAWINQEKTDYIAYVMKKQDLDILWYDETEDHLFFIEKGLGTGEDAIPLSTEVTKGTTQNTWVCEVEALDWTVTFTVDEDILTSIQFEGSNEGQKDGTYTAPAPTFETVEDILDTVTNFPSGEYVAPDNAWKNLKGLELYKDTGMGGLWANDSASVELTQSVTSSGANWTCNSDDGTTFTFNINMTSGVLTSVTVSGSKNADGTYYAERETLQNIISTYCSDFPTTANTGWKCNGQSNGSSIYICKPDGNALYVKYYYGDLYRTAGISQLSSYAGKINGGYECEGGGLLLHFNIQDNKLVSIEIVGPDFVAGTYTTAASANIQTIEDIVLWAAEYPLNKVEWNGSENNNTVNSDGDGLNLKSGENWWVVKLDNEVTTSNGNYVWSDKDTDGTITFNMTNGILTSITVARFDDNRAYSNDIYTPPAAPAPAVSTKLTLGVSGGQTHDAPMAETEVSEPTAEVFEPEFEPEKFEEAKPEELIEPAEAVAVEGVEAVE